MAQLSWIGALPWQLLEATDKLEKLGVPQSVHLPAPRQAHLDNLPLE